MFDKKEFRICLTRAEKNVKQVAEALGVSETTLYRKIASDGDFSREEMSKLAVVLNMENPISIFFADELAFSQVNASAR